MKGCNFDIGTDTDRANCKLNSHYLFLACLIIICHEHVMPFDANEPYEATRDAVEILRQWENDHIAKRVFTLVNDLLNFTENRRRICNLRHEAEPDPTLSRPYHVFVAPPLDQRQEATVANDSDTAVEDQSPTETDSPSDYLDADDDEHELGDFNWLMDVLHANATSLYHQRDQTDASNDESGQSSGASASLTHYDQSAEADFWSSWDNTR